MKKMMLAAAVVASLSGCSQRIGDFTVMSTSNINLNNGEFVTGERIQGTDYVPVLLFPWGSPNLEEAVEDAVYKTSDNCVVGLENVTMKLNSYSFLIGAFGYQVDGNAIYDASRPNCGNYIENKSSVVVAPLATQPVSVHINNTNN